MRMIITPMDNTHIHTYTHIHAYITTYTYISATMCVRAYMCVCAYMRAYASVYMCVCACMHCAYICACVCMEHKTSQSPSQHHHRYHQPFLLKLFSLSLSLLDIAMKTKTNMECNNPDCEKETAYLAQNIARPI